MNSSQVNRFKHLRLRRSRFLNHLNFLLRCRRARVFPKFINIKFKVPSSSRVNKAIMRSKFAILRAVIQDVRQSLSSIEHELYYLHLYLSNSDPYFSSFEKRNFAHVEYKSSRHKDVLDKKFSSLLNSNNYSSVSPVSPLVQDSVVNLSSHSLTNSQRDVLSLGLNFSRVSKPSIPNLIAPIEQSFKNSQISTGQLESLRFLLTNIISSNNHSQKSNLSSTQRSALSELNSAPNLIITKADKGGQTVLLDKSDYISQVETMIKSGPYCKLKKDPSNDHLKEIKVTVKNSVILNDQTKRSVIPSIVNCARFYALPKIHKPILSFRPIVSNIGTASYKLARFLSRYLSPLTCSNIYTVKNSYEFVDKLKCISPSNYTMLSLDVKSLFTNVPVQGALDCLEKRMREFHYSATEIEELVNLVQLCVRQTAFVFNDNYYSQVEGLGMGSPLSPLLCDIYMHYFEEKLFDVYKFPHWFRYVDDTFVLVPSDVDTSRLLSVVNSVDSCIQFTFEIEKDNSLPFLDVLVSKHQDRFSTTVFRKSFAVSLPPHALSNHPPQQKMAAFYTYVYRALHICSDPSNLSEELSYLKSLALSRGYNPSVIDKALNKFKKPKRSLSHLNNNSLVPIVLPYYSSISYKISKILSRSGFKVSFKPVNKIKFSSLKDPIPTENRSGIYYIPCASCDLGYIGQTKRRLKYRVDEHRRNVQNGEISKSSIASHCWTSGHSFDFSKATIISSPVSPSHLDFHESFHIFKNSKNLVNDLSSTPFISIAWRLLI